MGVCAGEAIEVESIDVEALGRTSWGVGCGGMRRGNESEEMNQRKCIKGNVSGEMYQETCINVWQGIDQRR